MMKLAAMIAFVLSTGTVLAAGKSYELKVTVTHSGEKFASPSMTIKEGEATTVIEKSGDGEKFIQVDTSPGRTGLKMKFAIGKIDELGNRLVLARPEVTVDEGVPATFEFKEDDGQSASLEVIATGEKL